TRRRTKRLVRLLEVQLLVLGTAVDDDVDDHAAPALGTFTSRINLVILNRSPLPARPPVPIELVVGVHRVLFGMLLPRRIGGIDAVSRLKVLLLQCGKELVGQAALRPEAKL